MNTMHEALFRRDIKEEPVERPAAHVPARTVLVGTEVKLEPLDPRRHTAPLYRAGHGTEKAQQSWRYLPWGPFSDEAALNGQLQIFATDLNRVFYAICDMATGEAVGMATYLDIQPIGAVIEVGGIWFAPGFMRSRGATESLFLMLAYAMDDLGYRRMQWRCNALNTASRNAAKRLGFRFEGIWHNHMIVKGRNRDTAWYSILDTEWPDIRAAIIAWLDPMNFDSEGVQRRSLSAMTAALAVGAEALASVSGER
jgi:RimJ/RimL family protein N-acetyltransferase